MAPASETPATLSMSVDFTATVNRETSVDELNEAFRAAAAGPMRGILGVTDEPVEIAREVGMQMRIRYTLASIPGALRSYGVRSLPTMVFVDRGGTVREVTVGALSPFRMIWPLALRTARSNRS